ncbi:MAG: amino acid adenylation domain-containing protein, partial [Promethearchaeota archaeon]
TYWKKHLSETSYVGIPTDYRRRHIQTYQGERVSFNLSRTLTEALKKLEKSASITPFMTILAALACLIHRYTSSDKIIIGSPVNIRTRKEAESLIGCFTNILALCIDFSDNPTFGQLLDRVQNIVLNAHAHMDMPFDKLIDELQLKRSLSRSPLFQVMFNMLEFKSDELNLDGLKVTSLQCVSPSALFDLTFSAREKDKSIQVSIVYNTDLFNRTTIDRMIGHLKTLLFAAVKNPDYNVGNISMLTTAEQNQLLVDWNNTTKPFQQDKCIHQLFEEQVVRAPQAIAAIYGNEQITYEQLNRRANQLARYLQKKGIGPNILVGICLRRSFDILVGLLGILKAGGAYIPLDPALPKERLKTILADSNTHMVITEKIFLDSFVDELFDIICLDQDQNVIGQETDINPDSDSNVVSNNLAYIIYTSGSTGKPKGIMVHHRSVINLIEWVNREFEINSNDRLLFITSLCFDLSVYDIFGILASGASIHIASGVDRKDPERLLQILCTNTITFWNSVPAVFQQLIPFLQEKKINTQNSCLRLVFLSGDWIPVSLPDNIRNHFSNCKLVGLGGATEATVWSNYYIISDVNLDWKSIPYGKPIQNSQYYILDDFLNLCPIGVSGKLYIGGECLCAGYVDPEQTKERFISNPFSSDPRALIYDTGDMARFHTDGNIEFLGRIDHQVKIHGYRIELGEVEMSLVDHPAVREVVALVQEDCDKNKYIVAYIVPMFAHSINTIELRNFLKTKLPDYMLPTAFVILEKLPLTSNGKINRRALPIATSDHFAVKSTCIAPRNEIEETLKNIWVHVLNRSKIGVNDNFFELGGHSLLAVKIVVQIRETLNSDLPFH